MNVAKRISDELKRDMKKVVAVFDAQGIKTTTAVYGGNMIGACLPTIGVLDLRNSKRVKEYVYRHLYRDALRHLGEGALFEVRVDQDYERIAWVMEDSFSEDSSWEPFVELDPEKWRDMGDYLLVGRFKADKSEIM